MAGKFQFDNPKYNDYTVDQLLNLTNEDLNNMSKRDISRVTRTLALAANKRLNRLLKYSEKQGDEYVPVKGSKTKIDTSALNAMLNEDKRVRGVEHGKVEKFSAGKSLGERRGSKDSKPTKNDLRVEFNRARRFMNMSTSTISGSTRVREARERRATGYTQEEYINKRIKEGLKSEEAVNEFDELEKKVFQRFRKYNEFRVAGGGIPKNYMGSDEVLAMVRERTLEGRRITNKKLGQFEEAGYIAEQERREAEFLEDFEEIYTADEVDDPYEIFDDGDYWT